jgi:hypothetical protein
LGLVGPSLGSSLIRAGLRGFAGAAAAGDRGDHLYLFAIVVDDDEAQKH